MKLVDTRLSVQHEADLHWYFHRSEGLLGLRSSFGAQIERLVEGRTTPSHASDKDRMPVASVMAATRQRKIRRVLDRLKPSHRVTLRAAFDVEAPQVRAEWSALPGGTRLTASLLLLVAQREQISRTQLRSWVTAPVPKPEHKDMSPGDRMAARTAHTQAVQAWRMEAETHLGALRREAEAHLLAASLAYEEASLEEQRERTGERQRFVGEQAR